MMSGLRPTVRARSFQVLWWAGLLLGIGSLVAVSRKSVLFGHEHLGHGQSAEVTLFHPRVPR